MNKDVRYPIDVNKIVNRTGNVTTLEKWNVILGFTFLAYLGIYFFISPVLSALGIPKWLFFLAETAIFSGIGILIFRFGIYKEDEKLLEKELEKQDSFSRFNNLRNIDAGEVSPGDLKIPVYQFKNGSYCFVMRFKFGSNNDSKSARTLNYLKTLNNLLIKNRYQYRVYVTKEDFTKSPEVKELLRKVSLKNDETSVSMMSIIKNCLTMVEESSNVEEIFYLVKTTTGRQRFDIDNNMRKIVNEMSIHSTAFRSLTFLEKEDYLDFMKTFYGVEAIDTAFSKLKQNVVRTLEVYKLIGADGRVLRNKSAIENSVPDRKPVNRVGG